MITTQHTNLTKLLSVGLGFDTSDAASFNIPGSGSAKNLIIGKAGARNAIFNNIYIFSTNELEAS